MNNNSQHRLSMFSIPAALRSTADRVASTLHFTSKATPPAELPKPYVPVLYQNDNSEQLYQFMEQYNFAQVTAVDRATYTLVVVHVPITVNRHDNTLIFHIAAKNPIIEQIRQASSDGEILIVFAGPHGYVSPTHYEPVHVSVPTWNYTAVHVYGRPTVITDKEQHMQSLVPLITASEQRYMSSKAGADDESKLWTLDKMTPEAVEMQRAGTIAIQVAITRRYGKFKLSQNKTKQVREQVIQGLRTTGQTQIADYMSKHYAS